MWETGLWPLLPLNVGMPNRPLKGIPAMTEQLVHVDPATLILASNVRTDTKSDAQEFADSIRSRGVLEVITAYRTESGELAVLRGQRRTLVAAQVGTPTGTVPVRVVEAPADADRIVDQLGENLHRAEMGAGEVRQAVHQLALLGVSPAQIAKRTAIKRTRVDEALTVSAAPNACQRMDAGLSLDEALIFAEFEADADAAAMLDQAIAKARNLHHVAQRLRDTAPERAAIRAAIDQLRADDLPVLDPKDVPTDLYLHRVAGKVDATSGEPLEDASVLPTATLVVSARPVWNRYDSLDEDDADHDAEQVDGEPVEDELGFEIITEWIVLDPEQTNLVDAWTWRRDHGKQLDPAPSAEDREAAAAERRRVIANNKAWASAQVVRREWLAAFVIRKTPPKGAEQLVMEAVLEGEFHLSRAMNSFRHRLLREWLGIAAHQWGSADAMPGHLAGVSTPKHQLMVLLAAVLAAWEDGLTANAWRSPNKWDGRILTAMMGWGYQPSEVEQLLLPTPAVDDNAEAEPDE